MATRVRLHDAGQAFTEWDLDAQGVVLASRPAQAEIWRGVRVRNHRQLRCGAVLELTLHDGRALTLMYPADMVMRLPVPLPQGAG
ncbi:hypothetical protein [Ramlibacter sp.]|uniref:hypothetical protein n=1 Tax=Ramlibacter sp. TaxID=1917967 RepID=UPI003D0F578D